MHARAALVGLAGVYLAVELVFHACGIRFDATTLDLTWQFLDPALLRTDLIRSLWHLHSQPPLFNLFLGVVLKVAPSSAAHVFHAVYVGLGLCLYFGLIVLMRRLGVRAVFAVPAATLFVVSPSFVLYEHFLFYTFPTAVLVLASVVALARFIERPSNRRAFAFCSLLLLLCFTKSTYQLPYLGFTVAGLPPLSPAAAALLFSARSCRWVCSARCT